MDFTCSSFTQAIKSPVLPVILVSLFVMNCAEVAPPPGGASDRTSPYIIGSIPANSAVNVEPGNSIILYFSERIVKAPGKKAVFISPRPKVEPKIKWKSDHIIVTLSDSFKTNQTYIISVSSEIKDARRNSLDSSTIVAFSTGSTIDSGEISGYIFSSDKPQSGMLVALYDPIFFDDGIALDSLYPDYIAQSNKSGFFSFQYLPQKDYRLIAFSDYNQNEQINPGREPFAVPDRPISIGGKLPLDNLNLPVTSQDTLLAEIISAIYTPDKLVRIRLSTEIKLDLLKQNPSNFLLRSVSDTSRVIYAQALLESNIAETSTINFFVGELEEDHYRLELIYNPDTPVIHFAKMTVKVRDDTNPPKIIAFYPDRTPQFIDQLKVGAYLSEPVDTSRLSDETFVLWDKDDYRVALTYQWLDAFHIQFNSDSLIPGMSYRLHITEFEVADYAGNVMGDSLIEYPINLLDNDSLGTVSGEIDIIIEDKTKDPVALEFLKIENNQRFNLPVSGHRFNIDLPTGKYLLSGFIDSDLDGRRGAGSLYPYRYSETAASYLDTITVRARFETTGIFFEFR